MTTLNALVTRLARGAGLCALSAATLLLLVIATPVYAQPLPEHPASTSATTPVAALAPPSGGSPIFWAPLSYDTGTDPWAVAVGDLNSDGLPDVAVASKSSNSVSVLLGNGDLTFTRKPEVVTGSHPVSVAIADANGDGRPDLAVASYRSHAISLHLGNGDGTFRARTDIVTGPFPYSVAIADLDADGRPDLISVSAGDNSVCVHRGNGDGMFSARSAFAVGDSPRALALADFNSDGRPDLAVVNYSARTVTVLLGLGNGGFGPRLDFATGADPTSLASRDFNGDSRPDLAVVNSSLGSYNGSALVLLGNGDGTFRTGYSAMLDVNPRSVAIADFNGDSRPDLAVTNSALERPDYASTVSVLLAGPRDGQQLDRRCHPYGLDSAWKRGWHLPGQDRL